uniref:LRRNT domain-containing protein n=1 Tax=Cyclopterus lumpus TaxID=8103 RepID=A0A8C2Z7R5_CYCLU
MCTPFPALLVFLLAFYSPPSLFPTVDCSPPCPRHCICYEHADLVDCRDRGFERVPRGIPHATWLLELGGNNLSEIDTGAFAGLWSLRVLVLTNSQIQEMQPFEHLDNLEKLDLSNNQLGAVGSGVFRGLSRLRQLYLHNNRLTVVQHGSMDMLPGLEVQ